MILPGGEMLINNPVNLLKHIAQSRFKISLTYFDQYLVAQAGYGTMIAKFVFQQVNYISCERSGSHFCQRNYFIHSLILKYLNLKN